MVMSNCRICQNSVPQDQTFCSHCGARQTVATLRGHTKQGVFARLRSYFKELFRSEAEKEAARLVHKGMQLGQYGMGAAIPEHEKAVRLDPSWKSILATTYQGAADELLGIVGGEGPLTALMSWTFGDGELKAKGILSWVSKLRQHEGKGIFRYGEAYDGLDRVLNGSLSMYDRSIAMDPSRHNGYSCRARAFQEVANAILMAYRVFPIRSFTDSEDESKGKAVCYGNAQLGISIRQKMLELEFSAEILSLYEQAEEDYRKALSLDHTDTKSYVELSHVLRQLGKENEATNYLNKALPILNKAIQVDNADERSYDERADIFEELGEIDLAIADLERALTVAKWEYQIDSRKRKIEELRKRKEGGRKE